MNTHAQNIALMTHALGKTPDPRHNLYTTYNQAGRALFTRYPWSWRTSQPTYFTFTGGVDELALPSDCDVVKTVTPVDGVQTRIRVVTSSDLVTYKSQLRVITPDYIVSTSEYQTGTPPTRRARIYPTPSANNLTNVTYTSATKTFTYPSGVGGAFPKTFYVGATIAVVSGTGLTPGSYVITAVTATTVVIADVIGAGTPTNVVINIGGLDTTLIYTRTWIDASDPGAGTPNIPPDWERALILMARAFSMHIENQTTSVEDATCTAEINRLIALDIEKQLNIGPILGGWNRTRPLDNFRIPVTSINLQAP